MVRKNDYIDEIDVIVGRRIQELRLSMGLSRQELANRIGVTHQQTQKYEKGINRISVGRLAVIAEALGKPITYFFEDLQNDNTELPTGHRRMSMEVARNFMQIKKPMYQDAVHVLVRILAEG